MFKKPTNEEQSFKLVLGEPEVDFLTKEIQKCKQAMRQMMKATSSGNNYEEQIEPLMRNSFGFRPFPSRKVLSMYNFYFSDNR